MKKLWGIRGSLFRAECTTTRRISACCHGIGDSMTLTPSGFSFLKVRILLADVIDDPAFQSLRPTCSFSAAAEVAASPNPLANSAVSLPCQHAPLLESQPRLPSYGLKGAMIPNAS